MPKAEPGLPRKGGAMFGGLYGDLPVTKDPGPAVGPKRAKTGSSLYGDLAPPAASPAASVAASSVPTAAPPPDHDATPTAAPPPAAAASATASKPAAWGKTNMFLKPTLRKRAVPSASPKVSPPTC